MRIWERVTAFFKRYRAHRSSSLTVRYMFPALLSSATVLGFLALSGASYDSYVFLETPSQAVEVGELFPVTIYASAAIPINAIELEVSFSSNNVDVFGVDRGQSVITLWTEDPVIERSTVQLRGGTFKRGFLGEHQIATINFRAKKTGQYTIQTENVRLVAGDGEGTEITAIDVPAATLSFFNFDENTSEEEIRVAIQKKLVTDVNGDGQITLEDISAFMGAWSSKNITFDFNGDGRMTFRDFSIILADFFFQ